MLAFPGMLVGPAQEAGIKVPPDPDNFKPDKFPHFHVFCAAQLGQSMPSWTSHWSNAKIVAGIPKAKLKTITFKELYDLGFEVGYPMP